MNTPVRAVAKKLNTGVLNLNLNVYKSKCSDKLIAYFSVRLRTPTTEISILARAVLNVSIQMAANRFKITIRDSPWFTLRTAELNRQSLACGIQ